MKIHAKSDIHLLSCEAEMAAATALQEGSVIQQLQQINDEEKLKNRMAIKALIRCTHFLARRHIPHTTNFDRSKLNNCYGELRAGLFIASQQP